MISTFSRIVPEPSSDWTVYRSAGAVGLREYSGCASHGLSRSRTRPQIGFDAVSVVRARSISSEYRSGLGKCSLLSAVTAAETQLLAQGRSVEQTSGICEFSLKMFIFQYSTMRDAARSTPCHHSADRGSPVRVQLVPLNVAIRRALNGV